MKAGQGQFSGRKTAIGHEIGVVKYYRREREPRESDRELASQAKDGTEVWKIRSLSTVGGREQEACFTESEGPKKVAQEVGSPKSHFRSSRDCTSSHGLEQLSRSCRSLPRQAALSRDLAASRSSCNRPRGRHKGVLSCVPETLTMVR